MSIRRTPFTSDLIADWANDSLAADPETVSDGLPTFSALRDEVTDHRAIVAGSGRASVKHPQFQAVNIVLGNLKTAINGAYNAFKFVKCAPGTCPIFNTASTSAMAYARYCHNYCVTQPLPPRGPNISASKLSLIHNQVKVSHTSHAPSAG